MSFRGKLWVLVLSGAIAVYAVIGGLPMVGGILNARAQQTVSDPNAQLKIVESVLNHIQNDYVDVPDMEKVRVGALRGLATGLDPYSAYLTADQAKEYQAAKGVNKIGIGAEFSQVSGYLYVIATVKGSSAEKAGIKNGDVVEYVDSKATRDVSLYDARQLVYGEAGTSVSLRVLRAGEKPQTIKVTRAAVKAPPAESRVEAGKIGVIKVYSLDEGESADIKSSVASLTKQGVQKIVLDLRGVAGGKLEEGAAVANLFIKEGDLAKIIGKDSKASKTFTADPAKTIFDGSMTVLIDISTAGAAEALASAFIERKRGEVVGERSFGFGTDQEFFPLSSGGGYLLTVAKWASAAGTPFLSEERTTMGVKPSVEVKRPDTPEPLEVENLIESQDPNSPAPKPTATPVPKPKIPVSKEDIQLKKALELLGDKAAAAKAGGE